MSLPVSSSPVSVVTALRQSRKGRLSYDRHWMERNSSVERVVHEVTSGMGGLGIGDSGGRSSKCEPLGSGKVRQKDRDKVRETGMSPVNRSIEGGFMSPVTRSKLEAGTAIIPGSRTGDSALVLMSPVTRVKEAVSLPVLSPVNVSINRAEERDIGNPRCIVMARDSENSLPSETSLNMSRSHNYSLNNSQNYSLNTSHGINYSLNHSCTQNSSQNSSLFIYDTPEIVKYQKFPRVDLPKLRLPPSLFVGREDSTEDESDTEYFGIKDNKVIDLVTAAGEGKENFKPLDKSKDEVELVVSSPQSPVEEELIRYEFKCREDAERRVEERKAKWEEASRERDREAREMLEIEKSNSIRCEEKEVNFAEIEKRIEEKLRMQQQEREERQKELIQQAKREEQLAKEQLEKRKRVSDQTEQLSPVHSRIKAAIQQLLGLWSSQADKQLFRVEVGQLVPQLLQECNGLLKEARSKVVEGECGRDVFEKLAALEGNLGTTIQMLEEDLAKIEKDKKDEEEKLQQLQLKKEEERQAAEVAASAASAAAAAQEKQAAAVVAVPTPQVSQEASIPVAIIPATSTAASVPIATGGVLNSISSENKAWYDSIVKFKTEFVKDVTFTEAEKPYKFSLQKAVNTPLNSLSGVSPSHLQDKVDKLVQLLSGQQVTVVDKTISTTQHPHARSFCLALAAKKLAKQGEDVVSVDAKSAFPAATLALALWDKYPEFGHLLLAYMFEMCPFLVPFHPQQSAGQDDKSYYITLGYKYEGESIEKQDKYLKRMSGLARLYSALSVSHLPKASTTTTHPHPPSKSWSSLTSLLNLTPHTDITASLLLDMLEVGGNTMFANYGKQFGKLLVVIKDKYFPLLEAVKSEGGPTVRLEQFLTTAIRGQSIREPEGILRQGFV